MSTATGIPADPKAIIRRRQVSSLTGLSPTTLWRLERDGRFPSRVQLSAGAVGWRLGDVLAWLSTRPVVAS